MNRKTPTQNMADELRAIEAALEAMDQASAEVTGPLARMLERQYKELLDLRDRELREWNEEASALPTAARAALYRCDSTKPPYHSQQHDGPCDVYTPNYRYVSPGDVEHLCDTCKAAASKGAAS